ncbi:hypothetical protein ULMA_25010 [Patiriisocius marinus]|uniref:Peptide-N-glycosidase F N-terminal domain-containing protein n=1 Tax=Patiriisocius marinus TaxID=1397112 RepID=A0A5J4J3E3_9FLAO|nr:peptide-N-glycosidase F-related protein [Patiriisocius marinus]GER60393.1 hypothetical protein ULMA_25010 [Patiriisocius marinus]
MKKATSLVAIAVFFTTLFANSIFAQSTSITVFDEVLFYDGYAGLVDEADLYEPMPPEVLRHSNSNYAVKLTADQLSAIGNKLTLDVTLKAACDNYDRIARVYLAMVPTGQATYVSSEVDRIEISRFITPFMNKNNAPMEVPFTFTMDNVAEILNDPTLTAQYDFWMELDVFGVPYAAQTQVAGCDGRIDTFYGTLVLTTETDSSQTFPNDNFILPLLDNYQLNNYNGTDVPDETTKIVSFTLDQAVEDLSLFLITSNHGANAGGEEYERRDHFVYLDNTLVKEYIPGGKSCEPWRQYNTQGNGIYSPSPRTTRFWLSFNNWCPGDVIPIREISLGNLAAGTHEIKIDVPDAQFVNDEGYIPVSMYLQNRTSFQPLCVDPTDFNGYQTNTDGDILVEWMENGDATQWEVLYGRTSLINDETYIIVNSTQELIDVPQGGYNSFYVRALCDSDFTSNWVGPINIQNILGTNNNAFNSFEFYPNPASNNVNLSANNIIDQVSIIDLSGKQLLNQSISQTTGTINIENIPSGVYFMNVSIEGSIKTHKLIIK